MSFLDLDEALIGLADEIEITTSPITDIKEFSPVDVGIIEGAISTTRDEEVAKKLRANCKILMVWGDCACFGGICTMRNLFSKEEVLRRCYIETESTKNGKIPSSEDLPPLTEVRPINQVVKVDCYVPGCPPSSKAMRSFVKGDCSGRCRSLLPESVASAR
jgi:NAD-reducing hydrogenase small subunit